MINKSATYNLRLGFKKKGITSIRRRGRTAYCCCCYCCWNNFLLFLLALTWVYLGFADAPLQTISMNAKNPTSFYIPQFLSLLSSLFPSSIHSRPTVSEQRVLLKSICFKWESPTIGGTDMPQKGHKVELYWNSDYFTFFTSLTIVGAVARESDLLPKLSNTISHNSSRVIEVLWWIDGFISLQSMDKTS